MSSETTTPAAANVLLVGLHRPTARRFCLPVRAGDEFDLRRFWKALGHHARSLGFAPRDYTAAGMRRGGPADKWGHDERLSEAVEAARPPLPAPAVGS